MAYRLRRITADPNSPMRVMISDPVNGGGLLNSGGTFYFAPAGQDGDSHDVSEFVAKEVMRDKGMANHFSCDPPLEPVQPEPVAASNEAKDEIPKRRRGRNSGEAAATE